MPILSARFLALPAAALGVIVALALAQVHSETTIRSAEIVATVQRVTNCPASTNTLMTACAVATADGATLLR